MANARSSNALMQLAVLASISAISCFVLYEVYRRKNLALDGKKSKAKEQDDAKECAVVEESVNKMKKTAKPTPVAPKKTLKPQESTDPTHTKDSNGQMEASAATQKYKAGAYAEAIQLYGLAIELCEQTVPLDQRNLKVMYANRAAAYEKLGDHMNVIKDCSSAIKIDNRHAKAFMRRAKAKAMVGDMAGALVDFVCLLVISEQKGEQLDEKLAVDISKVHAEVTAEQTKEAMEKVKKVTKRYLPDTFFVTSYYSSFHADDDENDIVADKSSASYTVELEKLGKSDAVRAARGELLVKRALAFKQETEYDEAATDLEQALSLLAPSDLAYYTANVECGTYFHLRGEFEKAKACFEAALSVKPSSIFAKIRMGGLCFDQKDLPGALSWFDQALAIKPESSTAHFHRGQLHSIDTSGEAQETLALAFKDLERCIELAPDFTMAYIQLGVTHARIGSFDKAAEYLKLASELSPNVPEIYNYLGETYMQMMQVPGSGVDLKMVEDMFEKSIEMDPSYPMAYINQGNLLVQKGSQYGHEALALFEKAVRMCPRSKFAYCHLAQVYMAMQDYPRAVDQVDKAIGFAFTEEELSELFGLRITAETHQKAQLLLK
ncbi:TPA: hypothetical protein N0F65_007370 [Lagenidium giganteum]|uniref:Mitochondrial import receptor subunit TOM70 n=1 Tax=Lagenidium giganteum TaxID=4803 RepID=A0AAV2YK97_9STRA|nr:TPA: hypothetical protein N0F65_007370 [Lagenidium giganteum]